MSRRFPYIDLLRFIAALAIVVHHIEQYRDEMLLPSHWNNPIVHNLGHIAVTFFFVLSGFLVANSLIRQRDNGSLNIRHSYRRRALRILPLYLLLVVSSALIFQHIPSWQSDSSTLSPMEFVLYLFLFPNVAITLFPPNAFLAHTWFIGTLEQTYLVLPPLFRTKNSRTIATIIAIICIYWVLGALFKFTHCPQYLYEFWHYFNIDVILIGVLLAMLQHGNSRITAILTNRWGLLFTIVATVALIASGYTIPFVYKQMLALLFGVLILNVATTNRISKIFENCITRFLGDISYALFLFIPFVLSP